MRPPTHSVGLRGLATSSAFWGIVALSALLLFNLFFTDGFFHIEVRNGCLYGSLVDILDRAAPILLVSLGMTLVIATGGVDLSVGAVMAIAGTIAAALVGRPDYSPLTRLGLPPLLPVALGGVAMAALLSGALNGALVAWARIQPIVATLFLMVAGRGAAQLLAQGQVVAFQHPGLAYLGNGFLLGFPVSITIAFGAYALVGSLVRGTALGLFIEASGDNDKSAHRSGVPVAGVIFFAYVLSAVCSAGAGLLVVADIRAADANNAGLYAELDAILAVVIGGATLKGGRFNLRGTILGVLILQTLTTTILTRGVPVEYTLLVKSVVIIALCLARSPAFWSRISRISGGGP
jgi:ribose/xylose/arabinose/galactoside ABC-type transport system permease subunit